MNQIMPQQLSTVLSCIQPTAEMHIGNYFGAIANWVQLQESYRCFFGVVDLHAMTMPYEPTTLRQNTQRMIIDLLACGIDPEKSVIFIQSLVPEHVQLFWILNCLCPYGELSRMTQFKDKSTLLKKNASTDFVSSGLFTYPILQAADILIYRAQYVPVGKDQEQHLEMARNLAQRFNNHFGEFFPEPKPLFTSTSKVMSLADPSRKMSKSLGDKHFVGLFEQDESIRNKIRSAVTDSGSSPSSMELSPGVSNLLEILRACGKTEEASAFLTKYLNRELKYTELKNVVAEGLIEFTKPIREKREELLANPSISEHLAHTLSEQARQTAQATLNEVRLLTGLPNPLPASAL